MVWYGMVWYGMVWYGMVWYGILWYGMVVRYYALTDSQHVLKLIGSDCTAFGLGCTAFLCDRYFEIRTNKVLGWISTSVLRPGTLRLRRASSTFLVVGTSSST